MKRSHAKRELHPDEEKVKKRKGDHPDKDEKKKVKKKGRGANGVNSIAEISPGNAKKGKTKGRTDQTNDPLKKAKSAISPARAKKEQTDGKTMDYKQFRLKKMKSKWKKVKTKRLRQGNNGAAALPTSRRALVQKSTRSREDDESLDGSEKQEFGKCDLAELAHYWEQYASFTLSSVEREGLKLEPTNTAMNAKGQGPPKFFAKHLPDWNKWMEKKLPNGSPLIIVVCPSALRAVDLNRSLLPFKGKDCRTAKLIKRFKVKEQAEKLDKAVVHMAVGTPHRLDLLLSEKSLKLDKCRVVALDWSYEDAKKRRLITIPEIRLDVMELFKKYFVPLFKERENISLLLF